MALQSKRILQRVAGFSLIELMIVVAIIGILASIAIPSYEGYVARAKLTHLMAFSDEVRKKVTEYRVINGKFPDISTLGTAISVPADRYIKTGGITSSATSGGLVVGTIGDTALSANYTVVGANTGFPGGEPVIQLQATYIAGTASSAAFLKWTCVGGVLVSGGSAATNPSAAGYFSDACPMMGTTGAGTIGNIP